MRQRKKLLIAYSLFGLLLASCSSAPFLHKPPDPAVCIIDMPRQQAICEGGRKSLESFDRFVVMSAYDWADIIGYIEAMREIGSICEEAKKCDGI